MLPPPTTAARSCRPKPRAARDTLRWLLAGEAALVYASEKDGVRYATQWTYPGPVLARGEIAVDFALELDARVFGKPGPPLRQQSRLTFDDALRPLHYTSTAGAQTLSLHFRDGSATIRLPDGSERLVSTAAPDGLLENNMPGQLALLLAAWAARGGPGAARVFFVNALLVARYELSPRPPAPASAATLRSSDGGVATLSSDGRLCVLSFPDRGVRSWRLAPAPPLPEWHGRSFAVAPPAEGRRAYALLLAQRGPRRVLLVPRAGTWSLPHVAAGDSARPPYDVAGLEAEMTAALGVRPQVLRVLASTTCRETGRPAHVYEMALPADASPEALPGRWFDRDALAAIAVEPPAHRSLLRARLRRARPSPTAGPPPPWTDPAWRARAEHWVREQLAAGATRATTDFETLLCRERGFVARIGTTAGDHYFKAVPAAHRFAVALGVELARRFPESFPDLVAHDTGRGWSLTRAFGGTSLRDVSELRLHEAALRRFADRQRRLAPHADELLALGGPDRRPRLLGARVRELLADEIGRFELGDDTLQALRRALPAIDRDQARLAALGIPDSLEHGDFGAHNVQLVDRTPRFVYHDLTDASVSHPFFSLCMFLDFHRRRGGRREDGAGGAGAEGMERLVDAYLEPWRTVAPPHALREAVRLAERLLWLHWVVIAHQAVIPLLASRLIADRWANDCLRRFLSLSASG